VSAVSCGNVGGGRRRVQFVMIKMVPTSLGTLLIAPKTCLALGLANTSPATLAFNRALPTNPT
jgi:hypothetical protein